MTAAQQRHIQTSRFGELTIDEDRIFKFSSPILGFEEIDEYVLLDHADDSPFNWLQAVSLPELAFVVTNPQLFGIPYEFVLPDEASEQLSLTRPEDAMVLTIVNIPAEDPQAMTANLLGPIVINTANQQAAQVILSDSEFATKTPLLDRGDADEPADNVTPLHAERN
jgi:flagellar assembly factor FliW